MPTWRARTTRRARSCPRASAVNRRGDMLCIPRRRRLGRFGVEFRSTGHATQGSRRCPQGGGQRGPSICRDRQLESRRSRGLAGSLGQACGEFGHRPSRNDSVQSRQQGLRGDTRRRHALAHQRLAADSSIARTRDDADRILVSLFRPTVVCWLWARSTACSIWSIRTPPASVGLRIAMGCARRVRSWNSAPTNAGLSLPRPTSVRRRLVWDLTAMRRELSQRGLDLPAEVLRAGESAATVATGSASRRKRHRRHVCRRRPCRPHRRPKHQETDPSGWRGHQRASLGERLNSTSESSLQV